MKLVSICKKYYIFLLILLGFLFIPSVYASGFNHGHDHHSHHEHCGVPNASSGCIFKSLALPSTAFTDQSVGQNYTLTQFIPKKSQSGFVWLNWHGETGIVPFANEVMSGRPSLKYTNPYNSVDHVPNINDWIYDAYLTDLENKDATLKFKLFNYNKEIWVPLWKATTVTQVPNSVAPNTVWHWLYEQSCNVGLIKCTPRQIYQIAGYASISFIDAGFNIRNDFTKESWIKVKFNGFRHCFNSPPSAQDINTVTNEDVPVDITFKATDIDNNPLRYSITTQPTNGSLSGTAPNITYTPKVGFFGADSFTYTVSDGFETDTATVNVTVKHVNHAPVAQNINLVGIEDSAVSVKLIGSDVDGDVLSYATLTLPKHGVLSGSGANLVYTPTANYNGQDSFTYTVSDGALQTTGVVSFNITPANDAPVATPTTKETAEDTPVSFALVATDTDGDALTYTIKTNVAHGSLILVGYKITYTPAANYNGADRFVFEVSDGVATHSADVTFNVMPVNDVPVAIIESLNINPDGLLTATEASTDVDGLDDIIAYTWILNGQVISNDALLSTPLQLPHYPQLLELIVKDKAGAQSTASQQTILVCTTGQIKNHGVCVDPGKLDVDKPQAEVGEDVKFTATTNFTNASFIQWIVDGVNGVVESIGTGLEKVVSFATNGVKSVTAIILDADGSELERMSSETLITDPKTTIKIDSLPITLVKEENSYSYQVTAASSRPFDSISYGLAPNVYGIAIDEQSGLVSWSKANQLVQPNTAKLLCDMPKPHQIPITPHVKWEWKGNSVKPEYNSASQTPVVSAIIDTNGDGLINQYDRSAVVLVAHNGGAHSPGILNVLDGQNGQEIWTTVNHLEWPLAPEVHPAIGDIDHDGLPEIIVGTITGGVAVFENNGDLKWIAPNDSNVDSVHGTLAISDLNADGDVEVIRNGTVYTAEGNTLWKHSDSNSHYAIADLDGNNKLSIITGNQIVDWNGLVRKAPNLSGHDIAVADFNLDGQPEILTEVGLFDRQGNAIWRFSASLTSLPVVADFNGDKFPDIGAQVGGFFKVFNHQGKEVWSVVVNPDSVPHGGAILDLNNDGWLEIVYRDLSYLYIFDAIDGRIISKLDYKNVSSSWFEASFPIVADLDKDQRADIVLARYGIKDSGVVVFDDVQNPWSNTRSLWSQHSYSINHINDDGTIPTFFEPSWLSHNSFRANRAYGIADLGLVNFELNDTDLNVTLFNRGESSIFDSFKVEFYTGSQGEVFLGGVDVNGISELSTKKIVLHNVNPDVVADKVIAKIVKATSFQECQTSNNDSSAIVLKIKATGYQGAFAEQKYLLNIQHAVNHAPQFGTLPTFDVNRTKYELFDIQLSATDQDVGDVLSYRLLEGPVGFSVNPRTGRVLWKPKFGQEGLNTVRVQVKDVDGGIDEIAFSLNVVNRLPEPAYKGLNTNEDQLLAIKLDNTDIDGDPIAQYKLVNNVEHGKLSYSATTNAWSYTPDLNYNGKDSFTYILNDGIGDGSVAKVDITVAPVNDAPTVKDFATPKTKGEPITFDVSQDENGNSRGFDVEGSALTYVYSSASNGVVTRNGNLWIFTPDADFDGMAKVYYYAKDTEGLTGSTGIISINVERVNDAPVVQNRAYSLNEDATLSNIKLVATDEENDPLTYTIVKSAQHGQLNAVDATTYTYIPDANWYGTETITFNVSDGTNLSQGKITLTVNPVNDAPVPVNEEITINEDQPVNLEFKATDVDGEPLTYSVYNTGYGGYLGTEPNITFYPKEDWSGSDAVQFKVTDGVNTAYGKIKVNVLPVNDAPIANSITVQGNEDSSIYVPFNAQDVDSNNLTFSVVRQPTNGSITAYAATSRYVYYNPKANYSGSDSFVYEVSDGEFTSRAVVSVTVNAVNDAPVITQSTFIVRKNKKGTIAAQIIDPEGDALTAQVYNGYPSNGALVGSVLNGAYTPNNNFLGKDALYVKATDSNGATSSGWIYIDVKDLPNQTPIWQSTAPTRAEVGQTLSYTLQAFDPDADPVSYTLSGNAPSGVQLNGNVLTWTPSATDIGTASFSINASDLEGGVTAQTLNIQVKEANVAPVIDSASNLRVWAGKLYRYRVHATDANSADVLEYSLKQAPQGMTINPNTGEVIWVKPVAGSYTVQVYVTDGRLAASQTFNLDIKPAAALSVDFSALDTVGLNENLDVTVVAQGYSSDAILTFYVNGVETPLDAYDVAHLSFASTGIVTLKAVIKDGVYEVNKQKVIRVVDYSDTTPPTIQFDIPDDTLTITKPTAITGSITDNSAVEWTIGLYQNYNFDNLTAERTVWQTTGTGNYTGVLKDIDPTLLENGTYILVVKAIDAGGQIEVGSKNIIIDGNMKLGELAFTVHDATIAMPGLDVVLERGYDSRRNMLVGDFGYAWKLGIQQIKMTQSRPIHTGWQTYMKQILLNSSSTQLGTICIKAVTGISTPTLTVTLPNGDNETFQPEFGCSQGIRDKATGNVIQGNSFSVSFKAIGDTQSTLALGSQMSIALVNGRWTYTGLQDVNENGEVDYDWYIPSKFSVTTREGMKYDFDKTKGIEKVTEPNGNTLSVTDTGITHSQGAAITFVRDAQKRITQVKLPDNTTWQYAYDSKGDLVKVTSPTYSYTLGDYEQTRYRYDSSHRLLEITDARGVRLQGFEYDANGRLIAMLDGSGNKVQIEHQLDANTQVVTDRLGNKTTYTYDDYGNVTREVDALGNITTRTYNTAYDKLSETDALGHTTSWTYNTKHDKLTETNALGQTTVFTYDTSGYLLTETDHTGRVVTTSTYDNAGNPTEIKDTAGNTTAIAYTANGLSSLTDALGSTTSYTYQGDLLQNVVDALGKSTSYTYDANKRKTVESVSYKRLDGNTATAANRWVYDSKGRVTQETVNAITVYKTYNDTDQVVTERTGNDTTTYQYDANKRNIQTTYPDGGVSKTVYDAEGNIVQDIDRLGRTTRYEYDALKRKVKTTLPIGAVLKTEYDAVGNVIAEVDALGNRTEYEYDALNRKVKATNALGQVTGYHYDTLGRMDSETDSLGQTTTYTYNALNQRIKTTYADGSSTQTEYDALGRKVASIDELGNRTTYAYDAASHLVQVTDALGAITQYKYNQAGHKEQQIDALQHITQWDIDGYGRETWRKLPLYSNYAYSNYDSKWRRSRTSDFKGQYTTFTFDSNDRVVQQAYTGGTKEVFAYDAVGNRLEAQQWQANASAASTITRYSYDAANRLTQETKPTGEVLSYSYDLNGNKTQFTITANNVANVTNYSYDALNRLSSVTDSTGTTSYTYNAVGNKASETKANGVLTQYGYDARNRLTSINSSKNGVVLYNAAYTLDATGKRTQLIELVNGVSKTSNWAYDAAGRLLGETTPQGTITHSYDAVGNRVKQVKQGIETTYVYDANDRLTKETTNGIDTTYTYDAQGNTLTETKAGVTKTYGYDAKNQLVKVGTHEFGYDADGIRNAKTANGAFTKFITDKNRDYAQVVFEQKGADSKSYTYGDDLLSQTTNNQTSYFGYDALGSTKFLSDATGIVTDTYSYNAYGELASKTGTTANDYLYTGEQYDQDLSQYYLRARYYNQANSRFTQMDSWQGKNCTPITLNKYAYAGAAPTMYVDPSGNMFSLGGLMAGINGNMILQGSRAYGTRKVIKFVGCELVAAIAEEAVTYGIYVLMDLKTGDVYAGQSNDIDRRFREHELKNIKENLGRDLKIVARIGVDEKAGKDMLRIAEQYVMDLLEDNDKKRWGIDAINKQRGRLRSQICK